MDVDESHRLEHIQTLEGHTDTAWNVAWNPERPLLASCSADKTIRLFNYTAQTADDGTKSDLKFTNVSTIDTEHKKTVRTIAWSPSGNTLAAASFDSNVSIWEEEVDPDNDGEGTKTGEWECAALVEGHETECKCVAYSQCADGEPKLASCSRDKTVWIWEAHPDGDFECMAVLMEHSQDVKSVSWHPKEEILASASYDDTIKLYVDDPSDDWYCFQTLEGHGSTVWSLAWSPCGRYLASASDDKTIRIWRMSTPLHWEPVSIIEGHERSIYSISWSPGKGVGEGSLGWLASTGGDGVLRVLELSNPPEGKLAPQHKVIAHITDAHGVHDLNTVSWCPRSGFEDLLATAGDDGHVKVWRLTAN